MKKSIFDPSYQMMVNEIRQARQRAGLTQEAAGRLAGHSRQWIVKVEMSDIRLDVVQTVRLCRIYGVSAYRLVRRLEEAPEEDDSSLVIRACDGVWVERWQHSGNFERCMAGVRQSISFAELCAFPCASVLRKACKH